MPVGDRSPRTPVASRRRWLLPSCLALVAAVLIGVILWRFHPAFFTARPTASVALSTAPSSSRIPQPASRISHPVSPSVPASSPAASLPASTAAILRGASRDELLAYCRDLLANGGPPENIVALLEFLVNDRPELAIDVARATGRTDAERQVFLYATLSAWAGKDAPAALRWSFQNSDAYTLPGRTSLLYIVLEQIATDDPSTALAATQTYLRADAAASNPERDIARFTLEALIRHGHGDQAQQAIAQWAGGPEAARLRATDFEIVATALARDSYEQPARWLQSLPSSPGRNEAYMTVATGWAQQDAAAAMNWAQQLKPADGGDDVRVAVFARWLQSDRGAAMEWLRVHNSPDPTRLLRLVNPPAVATGGD